MRCAISAFPLLLAMVSSPALAEKWREAASSGDVVGYIDTDAIKRKGDKIRFWSEVRFPEPQTAPTGHRFDRMAALIEVDCRAKTYRSLRNRANLGDRLIYEGKVANDSADPVTPGTNADVELRSVCFDDWPSGR
jgi:hypothetical protein